MKGPLIHSILATASFASTTAALLTHCASTRHEALSEQAQESWLFSRAWGGRPRERPDGPLFFLGAGFLLLETKSVTEMSLLFGSTWQVNILIFFSILLLILFANLLILRHPHLKTDSLFLGLAFSILLGYLVPTRLLLTFPLWAQWTLGGLLTALPLFFAGMVFARIFKTRLLAVNALGYNLIGSILGGLMEYASMVLGSKALYLLALLMYLAAYGLYRRERGVPVPAPA